MRRNKVLNTLAAASMAAMMAVTAVPATTVLAAPAQESQLGTDYKAVLNTNGTVTVYNSNDTEVPTSAVKTTGFGGTYAVNQEVAGQVSVYGQSFDVTLKAAQLPEVTVDQLFAGQDTKIDGSNIYNKIAYRSQLDGKGDIVRDKDGNPISVLGSG